MTIKVLINCLHLRLREFRAANGANVTMTFALATLPLFGLAGAAIDYSHANSVKVALQASLDSAAMMVSKEVATLPEGQIQPKADAYFKALFTRTDATSAPITVNYTTAGGSQVVLNATASIKTNFMGILGFHSLNVASTSIVKWGNSRLRVALVLDNTGSMSDDGKMTALKTATKGLLDQLKSAAVNNGDVYVSIIPFSKDVNVGKNNYNATWIDWTEWNEDNGDDVSTTTCTKNGKKKKCTTSTTWMPDNHNTWNGCVTDRGNQGAPSSDNYDINVVKPNAAIKASQFAAEQYNSCPQAVMPLNYDWTSMKFLVNNMSPDGSTNQGIGLAHGWMSLVGGGPYPAPPAEDPNYKYTKVIILMTDGLNTENRWYDKQSSIDARQALACANAKAAGITLYTVQVNTGGDPLQNVLKNCASDPSKFFLLKSANQLVATFQQIGTALSNLRIAK